MLNLRPTAAVTETFKAKMFLASTTEVGLANENNIAEGSLLALFSNDSFPRRLSYGAMREQRRRLHEQRLCNVKGLVLVASDASFVDRLLRPPRQFGRLFESHVSACYGVYGVPPAL
ncbi:MAG: DUF6273 domain-containing protein [Oscillospiraceae bacterium]